MPESRLRAVNDRPIRRDGDFVLYWMIAQRRQQFLARFPDAVDLIVRGVRSGLPVAEAIHNAGSEIPGRVGEVFGEITGNLRVGMTLDEALWLVARRIQIEEFKFFVISLAVQQETGGNLAEIAYNPEPERFMKYYKTLFDLYTRRDKFPR